MQAYDWVIVGAGFTGATLAERIASELHQSVLLVDKRPHIAGNAYDYTHESGYLAHKYGPHIFHTNSEMVFDYLSRFTGWRPYFHKVLGHVDGQYVPIPVNLNTIAMLFPPGLAGRITGDLLSAFKYGERVPILDLRERSESTLSFLADYVYEKVFLHYTQKQWGLSPDELSPSVTARVPILISRDDRYFRDIYQCMPSNGYEALFQAMLASPLIEVALNTNWQSLPRGQGKRVIFTGPIDEYFDFSEGELPYRSLRFEQELSSQERFQAVGTVNFPNEFRFTRVTEQKVLTGQEGPNSLLIYEYPESYRRGENEPYYPIPTAASSELVSAYTQMARARRGEVWLAGRLGDYAYYNMDQACARALSLFEKQIRPAVD